MGHRPKVAPSWTSALDRLDSGARPTTIGTDTAAVTHDHREFRAAAAVVASAIGLFAAITNSVAVAVLLFAVLFKRAVVEIIRDPVAIQILVTDVPLAVTILVPLSGVDHCRAVVRIISDSIEVFISTAVTMVTNPIPILVALVWVGMVRAIVLRVRDRVSVAVWRHASNPLDRSLLDLRLDGQLHNFATRRSPGTAGEKNGCQGSHAQQL